MATAQIASFNVYAHNPKYFAAISPFGISFKLSTVTLNRQELEDNFSGAGIQLPTQILDGARQQQRRHPLILKNEATQYYDTWLTINGAVYNSVNFDTGMALAVFSDDPDQAFYRHRFQLYLEDALWKTSITSANSATRRAFPCSARALPATRRTGTALRIPQLIWEFCSMFSRDQKTGAIVYQARAPAR